MKVKIAYIILALMSVLFHKTAAQTLRSITIIDHKDTLKDEYFNTIEEAYHNNIQLIRDWHKEGYLLASTDSLYHQDTLMMSYINKGIKYQWNEIIISHLPENLQSHIKNKWGKTFSRIAHPDELKSLYDFIYDFAEMNQYPFAEVYFDSIHINQGEITARLQYLPGLQSHIDSIKIHYDDYLSEGFVKNYFGLYHNMPYDINTFKKLNSKVNALPFVRQSQPWDIHFGIEKNVLNMYLRERKANQANAILGLQPSGDESRRYMVTADVLFRVYNTFGYGEMFHLTYQQIQNNSPKFYTAIQWPYIFNTKWGIDAQFDFMKYDTLFRKTNAHVGLQYHIDEQNNFSIFYENESNRTIHFDTTYLRVHKKLPANIDVRKQGMGISYQLGNLDDFFIPTKGLLARLSGVGFSKNILKNNAVDIISDGHLFDYNQLFDTLKSPVFQFRVQSDIQYYLTYGLVTFKLSNHNGWIGGNEHIYHNELFTLGGHKLLRGFNELSIFSSQYILGIIEPRIYIGDNSYIYTFTDISNLKVHYNDNAGERKWMASAGLGTQLNTASGLFNIAFALGKDGSNPIPKIRDTRVHIGYSIYF